MDLWQELELKRKNLLEAVKNLQRSGKDYAESEMAYKILLRQEILKLRDEGVAVGVISLIAYGIPEVARARFKRDVAEANYKANQEYINAVKLEMRIIESQLAREWSVANE